MSRLRLLAEIDAAADGIVEERTTGSDSADGSAAAAAGWAHMYSAAPAASKRGIIAKVAAWSLLALERFDAEEAAKGN